MQAWSLALLKIILTYAMLLCYLSYGPNQNVALAINVKHVFKRFLKFMEQQEVRRVLTLVR